MAGIPKLIRLRDYDNVVTTYQVPDSKNLYTLIHKGYFVFIKDVICANPARTTTRSTLDTLYKTRLGQYYRSDTTFNPRVRLGLYENYLMEPVDKAMYTKYWHEKFDKETCREAAWAATEICANLIIARQRREVSGPKMAMHLSLGEDNGYEIEGDQFEDDEDDGDKNDNEEMADDEVDRVPTVDFKLDLVHRIRPQDSHRRGTSEAEQQKIDEANPMCWQADLSYRTKDGGDQGQQDIEMVS